MKLYYVVGSPNCRKVHSIINSLGLDVELEYLDFFSGDLATPEFFAINPNGKVPVLTDGDFTLWESNAIMQYLASKGPATSLFPTEVKTRADIVRWQFWEQAHYNQAFGTIAFETVLKPQFNIGETNQPVVDIAIENLMQFAAVLDKHMQNRTFVVGDCVTLADYSLIHIEAFKELIPFDWSSYPNLDAYYDRMRTDPHWAKTTPESVEAIGRKPESA